MTAVNPLVLEGVSIWLYRQKYEEAELAYYKFLAGGSTPNKSRPHQQGSSNLVSEMESMRSKISNVLSSPVPRKSPESNASGTSTHDREHQELRKEVSELKSIVACLTKRVECLEAKCDTTVKPPVVQQTTPKPNVVDDNDDEDDDDFDLFGEQTEEEKAEAERIKEERVKMYEEKKKKKPGVIAKSNVVFDVKPFDDETDMKEVEKLVRGIQMDGLVWGASKLVPVAYGINKLQITCVIEDEKVSTEDLEENITQFEDYVQSVDIAAFNKV